MENKLNQILLIYTDIEDTAIAFTEDKIRLYTLDLSGPRSGVWWTPRYLTEKKIPFDYLATYKKLEELVLKINKNDYKLPLDLRFNPMLSFTIEGKTTSILFEDEELPNQIAKIMKETVSIFKQQA